MGRITRHSEIVRFRHPYFGLTQNLTFLQLNSTRTTLARITNHSSNATMATTTYHCICTELALATSTPLPELPKRKSDGSFICNISDSTCILHIAISAEERSTVLKLEDGFEKRYAVNCARCGLLFAYQLDLCQFEETKSENGRRKDVLFVIPGGLMTTEEMVGGKKMEGEIEVGVAVDV